MIKYTNYSVQMGVAVETPSSVLHGIRCSQRRGTDAVAENELLEYMWAFS